MNTPDNDTNTYAGIADQYDALMTSGYYDYTIYADALKGALGHRRRVLEMGVGTGLVAEHLLERGPYDLVGIDNTAEMMEQARARLGDKVRFSLQDVTQLKLPWTFEAAYSVGGCWYFINDGATLSLCSHIDDREACITGLTRVIAHLEPGAILAFALQGPHEDYSRPMPGGLTYTQHIEQGSDGIFTKHYLISRGEETLGEQYYRYLILEQPDAYAVLEALGCHSLGLDATGTFNLFEVRA